MKPYLVGITGGSGSGKTTFIHALLKLMPAGSVSLLSQDNYYKSIEKQTQDENRIENFDIPSSLDLEKFHHDVLQLRDGKSLEIVEYTFNSADAVAQTFHIPPSPIVLLEGIYALHDPVLNELIDLKVFIDAEEHHRRNRRIQRDAVERGYDQDDVEYRLSRHHQPAFEQYILPHRAKADIVIPNNHNFEKGLAMLSLYLQSKIGEQPQ
ncbi:MAG: uridine-cytidine kinase [Burkholderiales bacterium]|nr:uridine-cytidine kinase [Burkholderiales bacterium]